MSKKKIQTETKTPANLLKSKKAMNISLHAAYQQIRKYMSENYSKMMNEEDVRDINESEYLNAIEFFVHDQMISVPGFTNEKLIRRLYQELKGFSFLNDYFNKDVEEVNVNSWNAVTVKYASGTIEFLKEHFFSIEHAISVIRKLLRKTSEDTWDETNPSVTGSIGKYIRITAFGFGIVDDDVGCTASIRLVNPSKIGRADLIRFGTIDDTQMSFLETCVQYGISLCFVGETGCGKTTLMSYLLSLIKDEKRISSIEEGMREFDLIKHNEENAVCNSVTSFRTTKNMTANLLVKKILTNHPDWGVIGEMKGEEALSAVEMALTGHSIMSTTHAGSAVGGWRRLIQLIRKSLPAVELNELIAMVGEAFPIMIYLEKLPGNRRVVMEIVECIVNDGDDQIYSTKHQINPLFQFIIDQEGDDAINNAGKTEGKFTQQNKVSKGMLHAFRNKGMPKEKLQAFLQERSGVS